MSKIWKRFMALALSTVLCTSLLGCGGKEKETEEGLQTMGNPGEYVYLPEWHRVEGSGSANEYYGSFALGKDRIYMTHTIYDDTSSNSEILYMDVANPDQSVAFTGASFTEDENKEVILNLILADREDNLYVISDQYPKMDPPKMPGEDEGTSGDKTLEDGDLQASTEEEENGEAYDDSYWENYWQEREKTRETYLTKYSASGEKVYEQNLTDFVHQNENRYFERGVVDENGCIYFVTGQDEITRFDKDGNPGGKIPLGTQDWICDIGILADGNIGVAVSGAKAEIKVINKDTGAIDKSYSNLPSNCYNPNVASCGDGSLLLNGQDGLYVMDMATEESTSLLKWMDCDINGDYVQGVRYLENGDLLVHYMSWEDNACSVIFMKKTDASTVTRKETIVLGCFGVDQVIQNEIVNFNKENNQYRIELKDYTENIDWSGNDAQQLWDDARMQFQNDLVSGNAPDMFLANSVNMQMLINKGVVEDLAPYLEKSTALKKDDFFPSILKVCTYKDVLYCIPSGFSIATMFARDEDLGGKEKLSMQDIKDLCDKNPNASLFPNATRDMVLSYFMSYCGDTYVDAATGECHFDGQDFKDLLAMCKKYPKEIDWENGYVAEPKVLRDRSALFYTTSFGEMSSYTIVSAMFDCPVTAVGFPEKGTIAYFDGVCISSSSKYKDVCFQFIERTLQKESVLSWMNYNFLSQKSLFDEKMEEELSRSGGGSWGWDDINIEVPKTTKEDVEALKTMIDQIDSTPISNNEIWDIVNEEVQPYFEDQKSLDEVTTIIQNRVKLYISENM